MKKEKFEWMLAIFTLWCLMPNQLFAQVDSVKQLDEVVITATRSEQPILEVPRSITVITAAEIERLPYNSVGDLLQTQPGLYVIGANQTPGTNQSLFMRGANSNQFVVLIDGKRITDPSSPSSSIDLSELSLTDVDQIEIIRGAHSTLFGGAAMGGAINIITRKKGRDGLHGSASMQAGALGKKSFSLNENLAMNFATKSGWYANGSVFNQNVSGLNATLSRPGDPASFNGVDKDDFRKTDFYVKSGYLAGPWDVGVAFKNTDQHADIDNGAFSDDDNAYVDFKRKLFDYTGRYKLNDSWTVSLVGSWSRSHRRNENDSSRVSDNLYDGTYLHDNYYGDLLTNELVFNLKRGNVKAVIGGGHYMEEMQFNTYYFVRSFGDEYEFITNYDSVTTRTNTGYAFAQLNYSRGRLGISAGSRYSNHSIFGNNVTYEISPSYLLRNLLLYASVSSGFNAPSLYQLYDLSGYGYNFTTRGNPDLDPERSMSLEVGVKKEYDDGSYFTIAAFNSRTNDAIEYVNLWDNGKPVADLDFTDYRGDTYINATTHLVHGFEFAGKIILGKFHLSGNATWLDGSIEFNPDDINAKFTQSNYVQLYNYGMFANERGRSGQMTRKPRVMGLAEAGFRPVNTLLVALALRHTASRFDVAYDPTLGPFGALARIDVEKYNLVDFSALYQIKKNLSLFLKVENLLDEDYQEIMGFATRGRTATMRISYNF